MGDNKSNMDKMLRQYETDFRLVTTYEIELLFDSYDGQFNTIRPKRLTLRGRKKAFVIIQALKQLNIHVFEFIDWARNRFDYDKYNTPGFTKIITLENVYECYKDKLLKEMEE